MSSALNSQVALDVPELKQAILWDLQAGHPVSICGPTGIGKSEICYGISVQLGLEMIERRLSQMTEGDMIGLPSTKEGVTKYNPPDWYKRACDVPCLLFFDERDRAVHEVSQAIMQIVDSRTLNGHRLHEGTRIISAINGGNHATSHNYNTNSGDAAENDRWVSYEFSPTVGAWLKHAISEKVSEEIVKFLSDNHSNLEHLGTMEPGKVYPSRRSWFRLDKKLKVNGLIQAFHKKEVGANSMIANCASYIGEAAAQQFVRFLEKEIVVGAKHILNGEHQKLWEKLSPTQVLSIVQEMGEKKMVSLEALQQNYDSCENKDTSHVANLNRFLVPLDGEHVQSFVDNLRIAEPDESKQSAIVEMCFKHPYNGTSWLQRMIHHTEAAAAKEEKKD